MRIEMAKREPRGIGSYTFCDAKLATKDVYRKPIKL
jgi:hypothetical protein